MNNFSEILSGTGLSIDSGLRISDFRPARNRFPPRPVASNRCGGQRLNMRTSLGLAVIWAVCGCASVKQRDPMNKIYGLLVDALGDSALDIQQRYEASSMLRNGGAEVIPVPIEGLSDDRIFNSQYTSPSARMGSPPRTKRVKHECEAILNSVIGTRPKGYYYVRDWPEWWGSHQGMSLADIRHEVGQIEENLDAGKNPPK